jgi:hypothetical protein
LPKLLEPRECTSAALDAVEDAGYTQTRALVECALTRTLFNEVMHAYQCVQLKFTIASAGKEYLNGAYFTIASAGKEYLNGASASARTQIRLLALIREVSNSV